MTKRKTTASLAMLLLVMAIGGIFWLFQGNQLAAEESQPSLSDPTSYFNWTNWQLDAKVTMKNGPAEDLDPGEDPDYNKKEVIMDSFVLDAAGDTIPNITTAGFGIGYRIGDGPLPEITKVPVSGRARIHNAALWTNIPVPIVIDPVSGSSDIITTMSPVVNSAPTPTGEVGHRWIFSRLFWNTATQSSTRIRYDFEPSYPTEAMVEHTFRYNTEGVVYKTYSEYARTLNIPQVVKATFVDKDTGAVIDSEEITGKHLKQDDSIQVGNKAIDEYVYSHYDLVNQKGTVSSSKETTWSGKMTTEKRGIIFYYQKKAPEIGLVKEADKQQVNLGDRLTYTLTLENSGNSPLKDAKVTDSFPQGMSAPENIQLDGRPVGEGQSNAVDGVYYIWNEVSRDLIVYVNELPEAGQKVLTYETTVLAGIDEEKKVNKAVLTGSNTEQSPEATEEIVIKRTIYLHVKQEVLQKNDYLVVPNTGTATLRNVKIGNPASEREAYTLGIPSYEADTNQVFKKIGLAFNNDFSGYFPSIQIPEFYEYQGYQLTLKAENHLSVNRISEELPILDYSDYNDYWLTVYLKPRTEKEGPPFYSWDEKMNDFGKIIW